MAVQVITTVFAPAQPPNPNPNNAGAYDLTTLAIAHSEINIPISDTSDDPWLAMAITQISATIANYCNRVFQVEGVTDQFDIQQDPFPYQTPGGVNPLQLSRWPVVQIATLNTSATVTSGSILPFASAPPAWVINGVPVSGLNVPPGITVSSVSGNNVTLSAPITNAVLAGTPVTFGLSVAQTIQINTPQAMVLGTDYSLNALNGQLGRLNPFTGVVTTWEARPIIASYYAGYATIPPDVVDATLRLLTARKFMRGTNPFLKERENQKVGRETYWVGGPPSTAGVPEEIAGILDKYRVPVAL